MALLATLGIAGWANDVHAQQQPAVSSSVETTAKAASTATPHGASQDHTNTSSGKRSGAVVVAASDAVDKDASSMHYQPHSRGNLDSYRNAVTPPPVDTGR